MINRSPPHLTCLALALALPAFSWAAPKAAPATAPAATPVQPAPPAQNASPTANAAPAAVFPAKISPKYAKLSAGQARLHTCLDQYTANKATHGNGGMEWIQKGGGYYSACSKRLKS